MNNLPFNYKLMKISETIQKSPEQRIMEAVSEFYDISIKLMKSKHRHEEIVKARQQAMFLIRENVKKNKNKITLKAIGNIFGGRDHSTVINALQVVEFNLKTYKDYRMEFEPLNDAVKFLINVG